MGPTTSKESEIIIDNLTANLSAANDRSRVYYNRFEAAKDENRELAKRNKELEEDKSSGGANDMGMLQRYSMHGSNGGVIACESETGTWVRYIDVQAKLNK